MPLADGATFAGYTIAQLLREQHPHGMPSSEVVAIVARPPKRSWLRAGVLLPAVQTGQTRRECRRDIRERNGLPPLP